MFISDSNIFVNRELCFACGQCADRCIMDNLRLSLAPCRAACPIELNCQGYVRLLAQGREKEAAEELRKGTPFAEILGRICSRPCETACERNKTSKPINIRSLKRYLDDNYPQITRSAPPVAPETGQKVAVIGSGPAGLMAAYELRMSGHQVTVTDRAAQPGGLLRYAIPAFRLPLEVVDRTIDFLSSLGVDFATNRALGQDFALPELSEKYQAIILAMGAGRPVALDLKGQESVQPIQALDLLHRVKTGETPSLGSSVAVIGGGNTAVDAAIVCRCLGVPEVRLISLERRSEMPAYEQEVQEACESGVVLENGWGVAGFDRGPGGKIEIWASPCVSLFDDQANFNPVLETRGKIKFETDTVILALGQGMDNSSIPSELLNKNKSRLSCDPLTLQSEADPAVFVAGDVLSGPSSVVQAMASGKRSALSVNRFLAGEGLRWGRNPLGDMSVTQYQPNSAVGLDGERVEPHRLSINKRSLSAEVEKTFTPEQAKQEALRCQSCGRAFEANRTCWSCLPCEIECPVKALEVRMPYLIR